MPRLPYHKPPNNNAHWDEILIPKIEACDRRNKKPYDWEPYPPEPPYGLKETEHWWHQTQTDDWWLTQMPISERALASALNIDQKTLWEALHEKKDLKLFCSKARWVISDIEKRILVFPKSAHLGVKGNVPQVLRLEPVPVRIPKFCSYNAWSLWATCLSCGSNKFVPATLGVCCYVCNHPERNIGCGKLLKKSLIHPALKKYY